MDFKFGDFVIGNEERVIKLMDKYGIERKMLKLKILKVIKIEHSSGRMLLEYRGRRANFNADEFRLATETEIKKQNISEIFKK